MTTVNLEQAQSDLQHLLERAVHGEPFLILREGKPPLKVEAAEVQEAAIPAKRRLGFLDGMYKVPNDIKGPFRDEVEEMFGLKD